MKKLYCDDWFFAKTDTETPETLLYTPVHIPHDWLIHDVNNLYETSYGWYRKMLRVENPEHSYRLYFEGVYMDCTIYVNGNKAFDWKYGYTSFEADLTAYVRYGDNEIVVLVRHKAPNSRWYSGAGIYRRVWLTETEKTYFKTNGLYFNAVRDGDVWSCKVSAEVEGGDYDGVQFTITDRDGSVAYTGDEAEFEVALLPEEIWDTENPYLFELSAELERGTEIIDTISCNIGFREIRFDSEQGFFLNGRNVKLNGVCLHHDLGCLGAAFNKAALRRQLTSMQGMGVNAVRTAHNPPAKEFMELCDEMGLLVNNEFIDMWEIPMTEFDYARFFNEWYERDAAAWVRRDRNHPSLIMWSIGNEILDTHVNKDGRGVEIAKLLHAEVRKHDPLRNAPTTIGSNYMRWTGAQECAKEVDLVGYNYAEDLYAEHHEKNPQWCIYGSETTSGVKSRGVYHFPRDREFLTHEDLQCSSLGNCKSGFQKYGTEEVIAVNRDTDYCAGMFIWTGSDYLGEPTPYSTKNSYYGPIDTAGIKKDAYWLYKAAWTSEPVLHVLPYWDWNEGQEVDVVVYTNLGEVELLLNDRSLGKKTPKNYTIAWKVSYEPGTLTAIAGGHRAERKSFGDSAAIVLSFDKESIKADGQDMLVLEIATLDADGNYVENARDRVKVDVNGARLLGIDNGDSTDYDQFKTPGSTSRRLFSGKAAAYIAAPTEPGKVIVTVTAEGLKSARWEFTAAEAEVREGICTSDCVVISCKNSEVPVRKIELQKDYASNRITPESGAVRVTARVLPANATYGELEWSVVTNSGVKTNCATVEADGAAAVLRVSGDGDFRIRCTCNNGKPQAEVISEYEFYADGFGTPVINPYDSVPACFASLSDYREVSGGGVMVDGENKCFGFRRVDFGDGADAFRLSAIHWHTNEAFKFKLWLGQELLGEYEHQADFVWMTYQTQEFKLGRKLQGVHDITFELVKGEQDLHFGGFEFFR
jgi:beta-galactosidase